MNLQRRRQILSGILAIAGIGALIANQQPQTLAQLPESGYQAPSFTLQSISGREIKLAQFRGRPVMLNFFASWCPPCQAEAPDLVKMYDRYQGKIIFLGIDMTETDSPAAVSAFMKKVGMTYPVLLDGMGKVARQYDVISIPTSFFINAQGKIVQRVEGAMNQQTLQTDLAQLSRPAVQT